ncbi:MAG TPA: flagellar biosynthesis anti-sigma factor FlgM [Thermoplasmata archaeon]|nr:flagellar biosynthesis anti-sigma factor FlgM [Thermoplasmata archaeon]
MIISNNQIEKVLQGYTKQVDNRKNKTVDAAGKKANPATVGKSDTVSITKKSKEFQKAMEVYSKLPDVREEKVEDAKERIEKGTYKVSSHEIAEKIVYRSLVDKVV